MHRQGDTRFARRAARESDGLNGLEPPGQASSAFAEALARQARIGQPRANCLDTFGVVRMPRYARKKIRIKSDIDLNESCYSGE